MYKAGEGVKRMVFSSGKLEWLLSQVDTDHQ